MPRSANQGRTVLKAQRNLAGYWPLETHPDPEEDQTSSWGDAVLRLEIPRNGRYRPKEKCFSAPRRWKAPDFPWPPESRCALPAALLPPPLPAATAPGAAPAVVSPVEAGGRVGAGGPGIRGPRAVVSLPLADSRTPDALCG